MAQGSIHDLEIFASVMRTGGFSEAATELGITQPSVSQAVGRIERHFDTTLIARSHDESESALTPTGRALAPHLKRALQELDEAADEIASLEGRRPIRIGIPPMISRHFFKDQLAAIREACGTRPVEFCSYGSERMLHEIAHHSIDVGMVASCDRSMSLPGVRFSPVASFRLCAALRAADGAGRTSVSLDEIADQMLISFTGDFVQRDALSRLFQSRGHQLEISIETDQPAAMRRLVVAGMGVGIATQIAFDELDDAIAVLPIAGDDVPRFNVFVFEDVSRPVRPKSCVIRAVKQRLFEAVRAAEDEAAPSDEI